jgi:hypothetical protein
MSNMFLNVVSTFKGDGISAATRQLGAFGKQAGGLGGTLGKVGAALATFGVAAKAVQFTQASIESARDLERNLFSVNTIFDDLAPRMVKFTENAEKIGLSQKDAAKAVTFLGSVLKQSGFSMEDTATETEKLVELGVDLAATYGYDVQEALLGMTALFRGEYDPIEKFGVAMKQAEINAELQARGLHKLTGAARRNAEQTIRMELLYERAADASGAFTAQTGNLFVEQKKLSAQFENMQATVGTALLPAMGELVETLVPLVDAVLPRLVQAVKDAGPALEVITNFMKDLSDESTTTGSTVSALADGLGTAFRLLAENFGVIVQLTLLIGGLRLAFVLLSAAMATTPFGWAVIGLGALATGFVLVRDAVKDADTALYNYNVEMMKTDPVKQAIAPYKVYEGILGHVSDSSRAVTKRTREMIAEVDRADRAKLGRLRDQFRKTTISAAYAANEIRRMRMQAGLAAVGDTKTDVQEKDVDTGGGGGSKKETAAEKKEREKREREKKRAEEQRRKEKEILEKRKAAFKSFQESVKQTFSQFKETILSAFDLPSLGNSVNSITRNIGKLLERTRKFASNISQLASMGLDPALLQQVIQAGPIAGAQLAASLVAGGASAIAGINASFGEFGNLASQIAGVGTGALYGTAQTVNNYSVNVTGGVATSADVGRAVVNAIRDFERQSGSAWRN